MSGMKPSRGDSREQDHGQEGPEGQASGQEASAPGQGLETRAKSCQGRQARRETGHQGARQTVQETRSRGDTVGGKSGQSRKTHAEAQGKARPEGCHQIAPHQTRRQRLGKGSVESIRPSREGRAQSRARASAETGRQGHDAEIADAQTGKTPTVMPTSPPSTLTSSRFADRFAPPKPPTRQMNNLDIDIVKAHHKADPEARQCLEDQGRARPDRGRSDVDARQRVHEREAARLLPRPPAGAEGRPAFATPAKPPSICARTRRSFRTRPTARPSRKSMRSSCARATASASC